MNEPPQPDGWKLWGRSAGDFVLFGVTAVELALLIKFSPAFHLSEWIYVCSNLLVLCIALTRQAPQVQDRTLSTAVAVLISYTYSYAQVVLLQWYPGRDGWPEVALTLVIVGAALSLIGLLSLGRFFGARPALRGLSTRGSYRFVRHPIYLAYVIQDIGYNLHQWSTGTLLLVALGWASMIYRIYAEERVLSQNPDWAAYAERVRYRILPGIW